MVAHDVSRIVYASSNHAVGRTPRADLLGVDVAAAAGHLLRRGQGGRRGAAAPVRRPLRPRRRRLPDRLVPARPETTRNLSTWLSHDDCVRMVEAALTAPAPGFAVLYGISANTRAWWDLEPGRAPWATTRRTTRRSSPTGSPSEEDDAAEAAHVGGPFAGEQFDRPALDR